MYQTNYTIERTWHPKSVYVTLLLLLIIANHLKAIPVAAMVVGSGPSVSCTEAALATAIAAGGNVTFNCGTANTTITISSEIEIRNNVSINGEGKITLQGSGGRIFFHRSYGTATSTLTLKNLTITGGRANGVDNAANGGAIRSLNNSIDGKTYPQTLNIDGVTFNNNDITLTSYSPGKGLNTYDFGGGAIFTQGGYLSVTNSTFTGNDANNGAGGAIHILQSSVTIHGSSFASNSAIGSTPSDSVGGAIYVDGMKDDNGQLQITRSTFTGNRTYNSGGAIHVNMYQNNNRFSVSQSSFIENKVEGGTRAQGGSIGGGSTVFGTNSGNASIEISNSVFKSNSAKKTLGAGDSADKGPSEDGSGGALAFPQRARITISNSTFYDNKAFGTKYNANGGALYVVNNSDPFQIVNSTFANNHAGWVGGAISNSQIGGQPGGVLRNTLFSNNTAGAITNFQQHCSAELTDGGNNLQYPGRLTDGNYFNDVTCLKGKSAPSQKNLPDFRDPKLSPLADNGGPTQTMAIGTDSPAYNGGNSATCPELDQRGYKRNGICDIGAYEAGGMPFVPSVRVYIPLARK